MNVPEPMTPADEAFAQMHEMWTGMRKAGFSRTDAAFVIAALATVGQKPEGT